MSNAGGQHDDVRMRGFRSRSSVDEALAWVDAHSALRSSVAVPLEHATDRTLAEGVVSPIDVPAFDRSAMDGYALRGDETTGATGDNPLSFDVIGQSLPGRPCTHNVGSRQAVRIMTGAPLPADADAVVPVEHAEETDARVKVTTSVAPEKHVARVGEDIAAGTSVLQQGRRLRPQDVGLLASLGIAEIAVVERPRVRLIVTGGELAVPGQPRKEHQIYEANSYMLRGLIDRDGGVLESLSRIRDERKALREALVAPGADLLLVSGGTSVGAEDFAPALVASAGELAIHGIAMRPAAPTGIGRIGVALVVLLPGHPVSCLCAYDFFAGRAIRRMAGRCGEWPYRRSYETAACGIASQLGRVDCCRVRRDERGIVPLAISGASMLSTTTQADGFVIVPAASEGVEAGSPVEVFWYDK